jgi:lysophospholipase L1-like esterase
MGYLRYVALGDSFTEGVGDPDETRPNGVRGWADRVAEVLAEGNPGFEYANLAIRGRKLRDILDEQLGAAVDMQPDLVTIHAGGNDILRPTMDMNQLMSLYDEAIGELRSTGATVLMWTGMDLGGSSVYGKLRGRVATFNEFVRVIARRHGARIVDLWPEVEFQDWRMWGVDRLHLSPAGHQLMAIKVLDTLGVPHVLKPFDLPPIAALTRLEQARADWEWFRTFAAPWVGRRLTGRSSGDGIAPKWPVPTPVRTPEGLGLDVG